MFRLLGVESGVRGEIKWLHTPDAPGLRDFVPEDASDFALLIQVMAGRTGEEGEESFDVEVTTPLHLALEAASLPAWMTERAYTLLNHAECQAVPRESDR